MLCNSQKMYPLLLLLHLVIVFAKYQESSNYTELSTYIQEAIYSDAACSGIITRRVFREFQQCESTGNLSSQLRVCSVDGRTSHINSYASNNCTGLPITSNSNVTYKVCRLERGETSYFTTVSCQTQPFIYPANSIIQKTYTLSGTCKGKSTISAMPDNSCIMQSVTESGKYTCASDGTNLNYTSFASQNCTGDEIFSSTAPLNVCVMSTPSVSSTVFCTTAAQPSLSPPSPSSTSSPTPAIIINSTSSTTPTFLPSTTPPANKVMASRDSTTNDPAFYIAAGTGTLFIVILAVCVALRVLKLTFFNYRRPSIKKTITTYPTFPVPTTV